MTDISSGDPLISFVTVTYGTGTIVLDAIRAIASTVDDDHEVIVVDNPPGDGRPRMSELLRGEGTIDNVQVVEAPSNLGFAGGNNVGVQRARGRLVCIVNPDVVVGPGWLAPLIAALDDPMVGIAAPVLVNPDGSLQEAGQLLYDDACTAAMGGPEIRTGDWTQAFTRDVDYASAACWLLRRDEFLELGGFDERYHPAYFEDVDYALRVEARGQRTRLVSNVPVVHHHGQGGAHQDLAMGQRSQATFRSIWAERIPLQPSRPRTGADPIVNRDRLVSRNSLIVVWADHRDPRAVERELRGAADEACRRPRDRVTVLTDSMPRNELFQELASAGLELVVAGARQELDRRFDDERTIELPVLARPRRIWPLAALLGALACLAIWGVSTHRSGRH